MKVSYRINGKPVSKADFMRRLRKKRKPGAPMVQNGDPWRKHISYSMGVHSQDVTEANEELKRHGVVGAAYGPDGFLRASGKEAKRRAQKFAKLHNKDSYE